MYSNPKPLLILFPVVLHLWVPVWAVWQQLTIHALLLQCSFVSQSPETEEFEFYCILDMGKPLWHGYFEWAFPHRALPFYFFFFFSCCLKKKRKTSVVNFLTNTSENIFFLWGDNNGFPTYETYYVLCTCWIAQEIVLLNNFSQKAWTAVCRSQQTNSLWLPTWTGQSAVLCAVHTARGGFCLWVKPCSSSSIFWVSL